jgi:hypothetical protein
MRWIARIFINVIPAKAGIQDKPAPVPWIPAFAGMTEIF